MFGSMDGFNPAEIVLQPVIDAKTFHLPRGSRRSENWRAR
jgi:hypothetical protein